MNAVNLFNWKNSVKVQSVAPWKPEPLGHDQWPPDYRAVYAWRIATLLQFKKNPALVEGAKAYYATRPGEFIMHWMDTYNPRKKDMKWIPFVFFNKQADVIELFQALRREQETGLVEKCRDAGVTWLGCGYSVHSFLFIPHDSIGWGSRKAMLVDQLGNPDSIFEKMRLILRRLPPCFLPSGWNEQKHATYMKFVNPENGASINGEAGDNIGRGGRKSLYFKDEAQPLSAGVLTPFGWRSIGSLHKGDLVCGPSGDWRQVIGINDCGQYQTYRLTMSDGTTVEASENHLWTVDQVHGVKERKTLRTRQIFERFKYKSPGGQTQYRYRLPKTEAMQFCPVGHLPLHPYVVGALLGDGSVNGGAVRLSSADSEVVLNVATNLPEGCVVTHAGGYDWRIVDAKGKTGKGVKSRARQAVKASGIAGKIAHEKFIPDEYKFASVENRVALLQGLMDTDGSASGGVVSFHTSSEKLADDVRFVVQSLGGTASKIVKPDHRGYRDMFWLTVILPETVIPFRLTRKIQSIKKRKHPSQKTIVNVEKIGVQTVRCISVDHADGLYITDGCNVTHNSAHYERPDKIEAALGDNTDVQIDISSVNGIGNVFHRRRVAGIDWQPGKKVDPGFTRVMVIDWRDHPEKTQEWYDLRRAKYEREGMLHLFAQEVDRDYAAAVSNTVIPKQYIMAAIDAHIKLGWKPGGNWVAGLDVADGGVDRNGLVKREGLVCRSAEEWGERDPGVTTRRTLVSLRSLPRALVMYDSIGVGSSVKSEYNRLRDEKVARINDFKMVAWNAGAGVVNPKFRVVPDDENSITNDDMFYNLKAQAWWSARIRFYKTWRAVNEGIVYPQDELISLDSQMPLLYQLVDELAQPVAKQSTSNLKMLIDKQPDGMKSPNLGDGFVMCYFPVDDNSGPLVGSYGANNAG